MRLAVCMMFSALAAVCWADRLINIPTGRKLPYGTVRWETLFEAAGHGDTETYFDFGIGKSFEATYRTQKLPGVKKHEALDLSYNILTAIPDLAPGLTVGIQDLGNTTSNGRRAYVALTNRPVLTTVNGEVAAEITFGGYLAGHSSFFVGLALPLSQEFRLIAEHNGYRLITGFELRPISKLAFRYLIRDRQTFLSASLIAHF